MTQLSSPFLTAAPTAAPNVLALLSLKRDQTIPTLLRTSSTSIDNADEHITNTRFGSFPHSTLVHQTWGSQVVASNVGARERKRGKKRKRGDTQHDNNNHGSDEEEPVAAFEAAASGFAHLIPPTPESWTMSLPHRTQVVYTPDYSYVLQRLRARPGDRIIEAGAGSGSFTHAAVRAVFNGYPASAAVLTEQQQEQRFGHVYSFEYHEPRFEALQREIHEHGLSSVVTVTHRDVYQDGFALSPPDAAVATAPTDPQLATAVFLDLPAPWLALRHLTRSTPNSPLHPQRAVALCSFSPCIEQAIRTAATMRELGYVDVGMAAVQHRRLDVRRERVGLADGEGAVGAQRGVTVAPGSVREALARLRELEDKTLVYHEMRRRQAEQARLAKAETEAGAGAAKMATMEETGEVVVGGVAVTANSDQLSTERVKPAVSVEKPVKERKLFKQGIVVHRTEPDLKTHTSYLLFGTLLPEWTDEDEAQCVARLEAESVANGTNTSQQ